MIICVSSTGESPDSKVDGRFGRCRYFYILDDITGEAKVIENRGNLSPGGAGIAAAQQVVDEGVEYLITGNLGPNAMKIINAAGIKAYRGEGLHLTEAVDMLKTGRLEVITSPVPHHFGMGRGRGERE
jgi:predicted Fe-Mo cluster-binding NifX family protein